MGLAVSSLRRTSWKWLINCQKEEIILIIKQSKVLRKAEQQAHALL